MWCSSYVRGAMMAVGLHAVFGQGTTNITSNKEHRPWPPDVLVIANRPVIERMHSRLGTVDQNG